MINRAHPLQKDKLSRHWCGAFTLYCAEWFRREYIREWTWNTIWQTLGFELSPQEVKHTVITGLEDYWKRPVIQFHNENNNYLGSVFSEGGLPLKLLIDHDNQFQHVFQNVLKRHQHASFYGNTTYELVKKCVEPLPEAFQLDTSVKLISDMADRLIAFVNAYELDNKDDPANYLDQHRPKWRELFPLPLNEQIGTEFLNGLLRSATVEVKRSSKKTKLLSSRHFLRLDNQAISSEIYLPDSLLLDFSTQKISTSRIELAVFEGVNQLANLGIYHAQFVGEQILLKIHKNSVRVKRFNPNAELYLVAMQAGQTLDRKLIPHSFIELGNSPVGFVKDEENWVYVGQASFSAKAQELLVILPENSEFNGQETAFELQASEYKELKLVLFTGTLTVTSEYDEKYIIKTNAPHNTSNLIELTGEQVLWGSTPSLVFKGVPSYRWTQLEHEETGNALQTFFGKTNVNNICVIEKYGLHTITFRNVNDEIVLRKKIGVLPSDFDVQFIAGAKPTEAIIRITTQSKCVYSIETAGIKHNLCRVDQMREIHLSSEGTPPANIKLNVYANLMSDPITLDLPFPAKGAIAYDKNEVAINKAITIDQLLGSRLYLFAELGCPVKYKIEATLKEGGAFNHSSPYFDWNYTVTDKPLVISLFALKDRIEELMALKPHLDMAVELKITGQGRPLVIKVSKYNISLDFDKVRNVVELPSTVIADLSQIKPVLMNLATPERHPTNLPSRLSEGVKTGVFELPAKIYDSGPWLIVPAKDYEFNFRAKFLVGGTERIETGSNITTLQKAVVAFHPKFNPDALVSVIHLMSKNADHSGWVFLRDLYDNFGHLPLSTFEVWKALVDNHKALCLAVLRFESDPEFIARLETEFSVFWEYIPIIHWQAAKSMMATIFKKGGLPDAFIEKQLNVLLDRISTQVPTYSNEYVEFLKSGNKPVSYPISVMQSIIKDDWFQNLLQQHSEDQEWPERFRTELKQWFDSQNMLNLELKTFHPYQNSVVYLPIYAAAVAAGVAHSMTHSDPASLFHLRKSREFDCEWFEPLYRYALFEFLQLN
ncbi:hypothetical protein CXF72_07870 [Psychromonas sp. MB-3u-54]|nr:hypothetical protein CXF72_07870 [Psychromonas sp. MB-3u-54]